MRSRFLKLTSDRRPVENIVGFFSKVGEAGEGFNDDVTADEIARIPSVGPTLQGRYDMIFLDSDHTYDVVKEDFAVALRLLNPGGTVVFHDAISWGGVAQLLDELRPQYKVQVYGRALNAVGKRLANKGMDGIGVVET